jgi:hypothetical protein
MNSEADLSHPLSPAERRMSVRELAIRWGVSKTTAGRRKRELIDDWRSLSQQLRHDAHLAVNRARRSGEILPPEACERCGARPTLRLVMDEDFGVRVRGWSLNTHHPDIASPLDIEWLCPRCHGCADNGYSEANLYGGSA